MVQPIDYMGQLQAPNLGAQLLGGIQAGAAVRAVRDERAAAEQARVQQEQFQADLQNALANPNARNFAAMTAKYPQMREAFKQSWDLLSEDQRNAEFGAGIQVYNALQNNNPQAALSVLDEQIAAMKNSGQDVSDLQNIRRQIETDPRGAQGYVGLVLSSINPDGWGKAASEMRAAQAAPYELSEKASKAQKAAVDARFAESMAAQDLAKKGWEIQKLQADTDLIRQNKKIAAIEANIKREENSIKKQEMNAKLEEAKAAREEKIRLKADEAQTNADTINSVSSLLGDLFADEDSLRAATGTLAIRGSIPGTEARSTAGKIAQLQDVLASANLDKLKGPMSDKDIEFVRRLGSSLDRYQDEDKFIAELKRLNDLLPGTMDKLNSKYGSNFTLYKNKQAIEDNTGGPPPGAVRRVN